MSSETSITKAESQLRMLIFFLPIAITIIALLIGWYILLDKVPFHRYYGVEEVYVYYTLHDATSNTVYFNINSRKGKQQFRVLDSNRFLKEIRNEEMILIETETFSNDQTKFNIVWSSSDGWNTNRYSIPVDIISNTHEEK